MRLITYLFAAALLWAVVATGPASPPSTDQPAARVEKPSR